MVGRAVTPLFSDTSHGPKIWPQGPRKQISLPVPVFLSSFIRYPQQDQTKHAPGWTAQPNRSSKTAGRPSSPDDSGGPSDWRALGPTTLDSAAVGLLRWGAAGGVLGAAGRDMADGAHVLAETVLHRQLRCEIRDRTVEETLRATEIMEVEKNADR